MKYSEIKTRNNKVIKQRAT